MQTRSASRRGGRKLPLSVEQVLAWADAHRGSTGKWPTARSGPVAGAAGECWTAVDHALRRGSRGLPGGDSLARLLRLERGITERRGRPREPARPRLAAQLWAAGLSAKQIARRLGVSRQRVSQMLCELDAERPATRRPS